MVSPHRQERESQFFCDFVRTLESFLERKGGVGGGGGGGGVHKDVCTKIAKKLIPPTCSCGDTILFEKS